MRVRFSHCRDQTSCRGFCRYRRQAVAPTSRSLGKTWTIQITLGEERADGGARFCRREQCEVESVASPGRVDPSEDGGGGLPRRLRRRLALLRIAERAPAPRPFPG